MEYLTTPEVAELFGCNRKTAQRWAKKNNVKFVSVGHRNAFLWTKENIEDFKNRNKKVGRPSKNTRKPVKNRLNSDTNYSFFLIISGHFLL